MVIEKLRKYELVVVFTPEATEDEAAAAVERVTGFISDRGGSVTAREDWGVRRLAYPIKKFQEGNYVLLRFGMEAKDAKELDSTLQAAQDVLRHLVTIADGPPPKVVEEKAEVPAPDAEETTETSTAEAAETAVAEEAAEDPAPAAEETAEAEEPVVAEADDPAPVAEEAAEAPADEDGAEAAEPAADEEAAQPAPDEPTEAEAADQPKDKP
ncbi:MAG: 30S ribosomal protein S6 [Chloroflexi bacterium]|nr:30S ribosomal protein S6 [Chloroflexota bacterium]